MSVALRHGGEVVGDGHGRLLETQVRDAGASAAANGARIARWLPPRLAWCAFLGHLVYPSGSRAARRLAVCASLNASERPRPQLLRRNLLAAPFLSSTSVQRPAVNGARPVSTYFSVQRGFVHVLAPQLAAPSAGLDCILRSRETENKPRRRWRHRLQFPPGTDQGDSGCLIEDVMTARRSERQQPLGQSSERHAATGQPRFVPWPDRVLD
ncbi:hypothetical protein K458DRAFT_381736 [Lentithecium fluviatile CBS 122367]|uniref:Uncharacterized protein n=1 Tax=Lentithecium fluviatile CBS 122367 TaxID=1168545 RepID=A0A6G1JNS0_9PLEO|nr:hypothetical protein K458DRAFT_381736 [Lentithecium fluviatile CBS 122367]